MSGTSEEAHSPDAHSPAGRSRAKTGAPRRYAFACASCKARKVKCSGDQPVCRSCRRTGETCKWPGSRSSAAADMARIHQLEESLRQSEARADSLAVVVASARAAGAPAVPGLCTKSLGRQTAAVAADGDSVGAGPVSLPSTATTSPSIITSPGGAADPASAPSIWSQIGVGEDGAVTYNGPTSRFHAGPLEEHSIGHGSMDSSESRYAVRIGNASTAAHVEALRAQHELVDTVWMPLISTKPILEELGIETDVCLALLDIYWTWLHPLHNCVYRPCFIMDMVLGGPYYSDFLLMAIFALAARHLTEQDRSLASVGRGEQFLSRAKVLLLEEMSVAKPRITTIQGLLILGGRQCATGRSSEGWLYTGMAIRMLADIGLHLSTTRLAELERLTPADVEARKRLYNSAYIWDKTISLALGRPPSLTRPPHPTDDILDHFDDQREWKPVHVPEITVSFLPTPSYNSMTFCAYCRLHEITTRMMLLFAHTSHVGQLEREINVLEGEFAQWYAEMPLQLKMDDPTALSQSPPPHIVSINLLYHALRILLCRPTLSSASAHDRQQSEELCIAHSKAIHSVFSLYGRSFPSRLMTYQVSYCIYTAATVDAHEMRTAQNAKARLEAASRLSAAVRVLQHEARHTPGSGKSLDTIRRQLSAGVPVQDGMQSQPAVDAHEEAGQPTPLSAQFSSRSHGGLQPLLNAEAALDMHRPPMPSEALFDNNHLEPAMSGDTTPNFTSQGWLGVGGLDTGFGFHPDAFPWGANALSRETSLQPYPSASTGWDLTMS